LRQIIAKPCIAFPAESKLFDRLTNRTWEKYFLRPGSTVIDDIAKRLLPVLEKDIPPGNGRRYWGNKKKGEQSWKPSRKTVGLQNSSLGKHP